MSAALDATYRSQRLRLRSAVTAATAAAWARRYRERERAIEEIGRLVAAGQGQTVRLVDAYMAAKVGSRIKGLNAERYSGEAVRRAPAHAVYDRPFGALGGQLAKGAKLGPALQSAQASLHRLVTTDLQLAQTHAARDWMADEPRVTGYERVLGGGKNCPLCVAASSRTYHKEDLMPIHEHCGCSVVPVLGRAEVGFVGTDVRVEDDPELGPRLLADGWAH